MELSKPRRMKPIDPRECFQRQQSLNMIVFKDPTFTSTNNDFLKDKIEIPEPTTKNNSITRNNAENKN